MHRPLIILLCMAGLMLDTTLILAETAAKPSWYWIVIGLDGNTRTCEPVDPMNTPETHIHLVESQGWPYKMVDVTEGDQVLQTTMIRYASKWGNYSEMTWYRGKERCEQAKRARQQQGEQWQEMIRKKYR